MLKIQFYVCIARIKKRKKKMNNKKKKKKNKNKNKNKNKKVRRKRKRTKVASAALLLTNPVSLLRGCLMCTLGGWRMDITMSMLSSYKYLILDNNILSISYQQAT